MAEVRSRRRLDEALFTCLLFFDSSHALRAVAIVLPALKSAPNLIPKFQTSLSSLSSSTHNLVLKC